MLRDVLRPFTARRDSFVKPDPVSPRVELGENGKNILSVRMGIGDKNIGLTALIGFVHRYASLAVLNVRFRRKIGRTGIASANIKFSTAQTKSLSRRAVPEAP